MTNLVPLGGPDHPSPITRHGPGASGMVKPEMALPAGGVWIDHGDGRVRPHPAATVVGASNRSDRLLRHDSGTSYAAALATHAAASALGAMPELTANGVRALLMASMSPPIDFMTGATEAVLAAQKRQLVGYGRPDAARATQSTDHRAVLIAEGRVPLDSVHLYRFPIPQSFFESGGWRTLSIGFSYDPPTRSTRLDYLANRMHVHLFRGLSIEAVQDAYIRAQSDEGVEAATPIDAKEDPAAADQEVIVEEAPAQAKAAVGPPSIAQYRMDLSPSDTARGRGAHQFATRKFSTALKREGAKRSSWLFRT